MKKFIGICKRKPVKYGISIECEIYRIKNNDLHFLGFAKWETMMSRGDDSEIMNWLAINGYIAKKYADAYYGKAEKNFSIIVK